MSDDINDFDIDSASKDELETFALGHFGIDLNKRQALEALKDQVRELIAKHENEQPSTSDDAAPAVRYEVGKHKYLLNKETGLVFAETPLLKKRSDLLPCDKKGNLL